MTLEELAYLEKYGRGVRSGTPEISALTDRDLQSQAHWARIRQAEAWKQMAAIELPELIQGLLVGPGIQKARSQTKTQGSKVKTSKTIYTPSSVDELSFKAEENLGNRTTLTGFHLSPIQKFTSRSGRDVKIQGPDLRRGFKPSDKVPDRLRYDNGDGVFGRATYIDITGQWTQPGKMGRWYDPNTSSIYKIEADFKNPLIVTPKNRQTIEVLNEIYEQVKKDPRQNQDRPETYVDSGTLIQEYLVKRGFDGVIIDGFTKAADQYYKNAIKNSHLKDKDAALDYLAENNLLFDDFFGLKGEGLFQDQVVAFAPHRQLAAVSKLNAPPDDLAIKEARGRFFSKQPLD